jgi:hypothetical protein
MSEDVQEVIILCFCHVAGVTMGPAVLPPATFLILPAPVVWATKVAFVTRMWMSASCPHHVVTAPRVATQTAHTTVCVQRAMRVATVSSTLMTVLLVSTGTCVRIAEGQVLLSVLSNPAIASHKQ